MILKLDGETLLIYPYPDRQEFRIDISAFPCGVPYHIVEKDNSIRFIPWIDAITPRAKLSLTGEQYKRWITDDGWSLVGIYGRNRDRESKFDHMIWSAPSYKYKLRLDALSNDYATAEWRTIEMKIDNAIGFDIYRQSDRSIVIEPTS